MTTIRRRGDKRQVQVRRAGHPGLTRTFHHRDDARAWARKAVGEINRGDIPDRRMLKGRSLDDLLVRYRDAVTPKKRDACQQRYRIGRLLADPIVRTPLRHLTSSAIAKYRAERLKKVQGVTGCRELALLSHLIEVARKDRDVPLSTNPVRLVERPSIPTARTRRLVENELEWQLDGCRKGRTSLLAAAVRLAVETVMRRSELVMAIGPDLTFCGSGAVRQMSS